MELIFILPAIVSTYLVLRRQTEKAFLNVYLPFTFLTPYYYHFRLPHLPELSAGEAALLPIGFALMFKPKSPWKLCRMDLWVVLFIVSNGISEVLKETDTKTGWIMWISNFIEMFLAYIVGRQLIEPELRLETIKRIVFLFIAQTPLIFYEYRFGQNLWLNIGNNVFHLSDVGWFVQLRGGTARIASCYGHAILAGIMFLVGIALNYYLVQLYKRDRRILGKWMSLLQKYRLPFLLLPVFLLMTNSRMPIACSLICFLLLQIPRFRNLRTGAIAMLSIIVIGFSVVYTRFEQYAGVDLSQAKTEAQASAIYRRELVEGYAPVLEEGGWLGYGALSHPVVIGLGSIDNNYMLIQLSQGKLGIYLFYAIILESVLGLGIRAVRFKSRESLFLLFSLLGALIGTFFALSTVYLGEQVPQVLFLALGWAESLQDTSMFGESRLGAKTAPEPKFRFRRVIA